jgi:hypothetical protein
VVSENLRIQLENYTSTRVTRQLDGALLGPRTIFQRRSLYEECLVLITSDIFFQSVCV